MAGDLRTRLQVPLLGMMAGTAVSDINISSTALVDASRGLQMGPALVPIASSAMSIVLAATVVSSGLLADRVGRRRLLLWALLLGIVGDGLTAASVSPWMYIVARAVVGLSIGVVFTASFTMVRAVCTPDRLGAALGLFGAVSGLSMLVSSFVGGSLATVQWRLSFLVVPLLFLVAAVLVPRILPVQPPVGSGPIDVIGQVLLAIGVVGPLYAISQLTTSITAPRTLIALAVGVAAFVAFLLWERRTPHPFFPVSLFRTPAFIACILMSFGVNMSNSILVLQLANLWQYVRRMDTVAVAFAQLPALAMGVVASLVAGRLLTRGWGERRVGLLGFAGVFAGFGSLALYRIDSPFWFFLPALVLVGAGTQVINVPFGALLMKTAPADYLGPVTASRSSIGSIANALGMAGTTVIISRLTRGDLLAHLTQAGAPPVSTGQAIDVVTVYIKSATIPADEAGRKVLELAGGSYSHAFAVTMGIVAAVIGLMGLAVMWLLRRRTPAQSVPSA